MVRQFAAVTILDKKRHRTARKSSMSGNGSCGRVAFVVQELPESTTPTRVKLIPGSRDDLKLSSKNRER